MPPSDVEANGGHHPPDTYLDVRGWGKGIAWVNGVNLGWYRPTVRGVCVCVSVSVRARARAACDEAGRVAVCRPG
mgnify:CR=1 FL=1